MEWVIGENLMSSGNLKLKITYKRGVKLTIPESTKNVLIGIAKETNGNIELNCCNGGWVMSYIINGLTNHVVIIRGSKIQLCTYTMSPYYCKDFDFELAKPGTIERIIDILKAAIHG